MRSPLVDFAAFLLCVLLGTLWLLAIAAPVLVGVPATWDNAPLLGITVPTLIAFGYGAYFMLRRK